MVDHIDNEESLRDALNTFKELPTSPYGITHLAFEETRSPNKSDGSEGGIWLSKSVIEQGATMPDSIVCEDSSGKTVHMGEWTRNGYVDEDTADCRWALIFTLLAAGTSSSAYTAAEGCTVQGLRFKHHLDDFAALKCDIACLSPTSAIESRKWKEECSFPFTTFSDPSKACLKLLGAFVLLDNWTTPPASTARAYFIFERKTGRLIRRVVGVLPQDCAHLALRDIKKLSNGEKLDETEDSR